MSGTGNATKKKSSNSGGAKKAIGDRRNEQSETGLGFFGAGGHVRISGILCLSAFGVLQPPSMSEQSSVNWTMSFRAAAGIWFCFCCCCFFVFLIFLVSFKLGKFLLVLAAIVATEGAIFNKLCLKQRDFLLKEKNRGVLRKTEALEGICSKRKRVSVNLGR